MRAFIDFVYTLLIGVGVLLFVSLGVWAFYSGPKMPQYPQGPYIYKEPNSEQQKQLDQQQQQFDRDMKTYNDKQKPYDRNVAIISLAAGLAFFAAGILLFRRVEAVSEGLALGGVFTGIYAAIRAVAAQSKPLVFVSAALVLAMLILLAQYRRKFTLSTRR